MLIADDEPASAACWKPIFQQGRLPRPHGGDGFLALEIAAKAPISVMITDLIMPDMNGIDLLKKVRDLRPEVVTVVITAYGTIKTAVDSIRLGASDYITKPFEVDEIKAIVARAIARRESSLDAAAPMGRGAVGGGAVSNVSDDLWRQPRHARGLPTGPPGRRVAHDGAHSGETGTGKELVARAMHADSDRGAGPFIG